MKSLYTRRGKVDKHIDKHALWEQHVALVRREALRLRVRLPACVELDDLIQAGGLGLLTAVDTYDPQLGVPFAGFAVPRIRFAMLDELRNHDWVPRSVRRNSREISATMKQLEQELGRNATENEVAQRLGISLEEYRHMLQESNEGQLFSYEESHEESGDAIEMLTDEHERQNPLNHVVSEDIRKQIIQALDTLPEREKLVLMLYYQEDLNLREIGEVLEVGESRVSQLHSQALKRLRSKFASKAALENITGNKKHETTGEELLLDL